MTLRSIRSKIIWPKWAQNC